MNESQRVREIIRTYKDKAIRTLLYKDNRRISNKKLREYNDRRIYINSVVSASNINPIKEVRMFVVKKRDRNT